MNGIVTLTTDFGLRDSYLGAMKGAVLSVNPRALIVDISHLVGPGNILEGAYILRDAFSHYPDGTVHVCVVDPGVGGVRRPVVVETERHLLVGPDNGVLSLAAGRGAVRRVIQASVNSYFRRQVSPTFHGRDIFGPVAAHLSLGLDPGLLGPEVEQGSLVRLKPPAARSRGAIISGHVAYIDAFGNLVTDITAEDAASLRGPVEVSVRGVRLNGIMETYCSARPGDPLALIGSSGALEIAINSGRASDAFGVKVGERVVLKPLRKKGSSAV